MRKSQKIWLLPSQSLLRKSPEIQVISNCVLQCPSFVIVTTTTQRLHLRCEAKMLGSKMGSLRKGMRFLANSVRVSFSQEINSSTGTPTQCTSPHVWSAKLCYRTKLGVSKSGKGAFFNWVHCCPKQDRILQQERTYPCHISSNICLPWLFYSYIWMWG